MAALPTIIQTQPVTYEVYNEANFPAATVVVDGIQMAPSAYDIEYNSHGATDTATITVPASSVFTSQGRALGPDWTLQILRSASGANANLPVSASIYAGFVSAPATQNPTSIAQLNLRFNGIVDLYTIKLKEDLVTFSLRSLAAPLTSDKISVPFQNQTTAQFITNMAGLYGLTPKLLMDPSTPPITMQQVLGDQFVAGTRNMRIWDLMLQCALWEDCDLWVDKNGVLWFAAPYNVPRVALDLKWGRDLADLVITHAPQFSKNIRVEVRSWNPTVRVATSAVVQNVPDGVQVTGTTRVVSSSPVFGTNETIATLYGPSGAISQTSTVKTGGSTSTGATGYEKESGVENYIFYPRNLQPQDALTLAKKLWRQISQHEYQVSIDLPVTRAKFTTMDITSLIRLHGTPYALVNSTNAAFIADLNSGSGSPQTAAQLLAQTANTAQGGYWPRKIAESFSAKPAKWDWKVDALSHVLALGAV